MVEVTDWTADVTCTLNGKTGTGRVKYVGSQGNPSMKPADAVPIEVVKLELVGTLIEADDQDPPGLKCSVVWSSSPQR
jgi:hypothetical protein